MLCVCALPTDAVESVQWQRAYEAWQEQRFADAQIILADEPSDEVEAQWLRCRLFLDLQQVDSCDSLIANLIDIRSGSFAGAIQQLCAEFYVCRQQLDKAAVAAERSLLYGGRDVNEAQLLWLLSDIYRRKGIADKSKRFAFVLWQGRHYNDILRFRAGLLYADKIKSEQPQQAREILSEIRLARDVPCREQVQAVFLIVPLLLPDQAQHAERIVLSQLARIDGEQSEWNKERDILQAWHVIILHYLDAQRADAMQSVYKNTNHPVLREFLEEKRGDVALKRTVILRDAQLLIKQGKKEDALLVLQPILATDERALCLAIDCGLPLEQSISLAKEPSALLRLFIRETGDARLQVEQRIAEMLPTYLLNATAVAKPDAEFISILLIAGRTAVCTPEQHKQMRDCFRSVQGEHVPLAMWYGKRAQTATGAEAEVSWLRVLELLPAQHTLAAHAAERVALAYLRPIPPGSVIHNISADMRLRLERLSELLSPIAWQGESEAALRCRYLLAQALAQLGRLGEARICFESLKAFADGDRKHRLDKALRELIKADSARGQQGVP